MIQIPYECFVIAISHRTKNVRFGENQNITHDFACVNDDGTIDSWANFQKAKTFLTEKEAKTFFEENKIYLLRKNPPIEYYNPRIVRVTLTEDCKTKLE